MHVRLIKGKGVKNHYVRLVGGNNETLNTSQGYFSHWNAKRAARRVYPGLPKEDENGNLFT